MHMSTTAVACPPQREPGEGSYLVAILSSANLISCVPNTSLWACSLARTSRILLCCPEMRCSCRTTSLVMRDLAAPHSAKQAEVEASSCRAWGERTHGRVSKE